MILVDTSVWVDHLRRGNRALAELLEGGGVLAHPFVIGELALGEIRQRAVIMDYLSELPLAVVASHGEVRHFIERSRLFGRGIGYVDVHLLAAVELTAGAFLWTYDKRLHRVAEDLWDRVGAYTFTDVASVSVMNGFVFALLEEDGIDCPMASAPSHPYSTQWLSLSPARIIIQSQGPVKSPYVSCI